MVPPRLRPNTTSFCHVILFAGGLAYVSHGIDCNRKIAIRIKTGRGNADRREHRPLGGLKRSCWNVHTPSRRKSHAGNRRGSSAFGLILDDDS